MTGAEHFPHSTLAQLIGEDVRADEEFVRTSVDDFAELITRESLAFDEMPHQHMQVGSQGPQLRFDRHKFLRREETAAAESFDQGFHRFDLHANEG